MQLFLFNIEVFCQLQCNLIIELFFKLAMSFLFVYPCLYQFQPLLIPIAKVQVISLSELMKVVSLATEAL